MIHSMTAYAREESQTKGGQVVWELRSINHRYLEVNLRLQESFRGLEPKIREHLNKRISRGKIECNLNYTTNAEISQITINTTLLKQLLGLVDEVQNYSHNILPSNAINVLSWPGVIQSKTLDLETLYQSVMQAFDEAITKLISTRVREGSAIREFLLLRLDLIEKELEKLNHRIPNVNADLREKLTNRLKDMKTEYDNNRLEQELVLYLQKIDVAEELNRLKTHVNEVIRVIKEGGTSGRRLDFLMQELHREANTLGSKSTDYEMTKSVVELKVLIDQMREQIQNIE